MARGPLRTAPPARPGPARPNTARPSLRLAHPVASPGRLVVADSSGQAVPGPNRQTANLSLFVYTNTRPRRGAERFAVGGRGEGGEDESLTFKKWHSRWGGEETDVEAHNIIPACAPLRSSAVLNGGLGGEGREVRRARMRVKQNAVQNDSPLNFLVCGRCLAPRDTRRAERTQTAGGGGGEGWPGEGRLDGDWRFFAADI